MKYLSLFSGIEAATQAWHPLGWEPVAFAEIEPFPAAVLAHHYPNVPNLGDVTAIAEEQISALGRIDVVVGGSPCQDLSIAGNRAGLAGSRSNLFFEQVRIFHAARKHCGARWLVWENVPGALSSHQGRDFAEVVGAMAGCGVPVPERGWGTEGVVLGEHGLLEWSVLDAQWFGLAQRRKRLFAVLDTGNWQDRPPILLERESLRGDTAPSRKAGKEAAHGTHASIEATNADNTVYACKTANTQSGGIGISGENVAYTLDTGMGQAIAVPDVAMCLNAGAMGRLDAESETLIPVIPGAIRVVHGSQDPDVSVNVAHTVGRNHGAENVLHDPSLMQGVRRLTPKECERLQGFPDDYTRIVWRGKPSEMCPDGPRYKALGNSMAVPVMRWIGKQIDVAERFACLGKFNARVLDPCCGSRMFWFDRQHPDVVFGDCRKETITVTDNSKGNKSGHRTLQIEPDVLLDFRKLPYPDGTFHLVSFDPPHLLRAGPRSWLAAKYGELSDNWREDLRQGFSECFRVLAHNGVLIFKWNETQVKVKEVLSLTEVAPLFGHPSGRKGLTHWIVFMKPAVSHGNLNMNINIEKLERAA